MFAILWKKDTFDKFGCDITLEELSNCGISFQEASEILELIETGQVRPKLAEQGFTPSVVLAHKDSEGNWVQV